MSEATMNGRPTTTTHGVPRRKQLSVQLDRMDSIIDALAEGLPEAVAAACKEGAREAVKDAIVEIFTNPDLRALFARVGPEPIPAVPTPESAPIPAPRKPNPWKRFQARVAAARAAVSRAVTRTREVLVEPFRTARSAVIGAGMATGEILPVRRILFTALGVAAVVGFTCLLLPQTVAAVVGAGSAAGTTVAVQTGRWLMTAARRFGLAT
jgi:hypothetical protein